VYKRQDTTVDSSRVAGIVGSSENSNLTGVSTTMLNVINRVYFTTVVDSVIRIGDSATLPYGFDNTVTGLTVSNYTQVATQAAIDYEVDLGFDPTIWDLSNDTPTLLFETIFNHTAE
jgi:hypothetical protein